MKALTENGFARTPHRALGLVTLSWTCVAGRTVKQAWFKASYPIDMSYVRGQQGFWKTS